MSEDSRARLCNRLPLRSDAKFVLYWMTTARRLEDNFALDRALALSRETSRPLLVLEALRVQYPWASDRLHRFVIDGMRDNRAAAQKAGITYFPYVEPTVDAGKGLLHAIAEHAAVVVTDEFPCFFLPRMLARAARDLPARLIAVDGNGLYPMRATEQVFSTAYSFRRHLQKALRPFLDDRPAARPFLRTAFAQGAVVPRDIARKWPAASAALISGDPKALAALPIDHRVTVAPRKGGARAAHETLDHFLDVHLDRYAEDRNHPDDDVASTLSPYLHFGHLSTHRVFSRITEREAWTPEKLSKRCDGKREGWWNMSAASEKFLDELITWRELGYNFCAHRPDYDRYQSLPPWAQATLDEHAQDPREHVYSLADFEAARTHDELWNAAQRQLVEEGRMQNYLRMLWGKKILEWTKTPRDALAVMIELNNKYALDGRNPNSYTGIFWVLGRYDRPWAPMRKIFGSIRYMSSANTAKKLHVKQYLKRYASQRELF